MMATWLTVYESPASTVRLNIVLIGDMERLEVEVVLYLSPLRPDVPEVPLVPEVPEVPAVPLVPLFR